MNNTYIILAVTVCDIEKMPLNLPIATLGTSGGYRAKINNDIISMYSPIDIAICGLTALYNKEQSVTSLNDWFNKNDDFNIGELWVTCTTIDTSTDIFNNSINTHSILEWKFLCKDNNQLHSLFKKNAPFTFKNF